MTDYTIIQTETGYKYTRDGETLFVPLAPGNRHYQEIQDLIANGAEVTIEEVIVDYAGIARAKRDSLLAESDWVVIKAQETGTEIPIEWKEYRQALRDITLQDGFPENIIWPEKP
jgi:hypothetical protein